MAESTYDDVISAVDNIFFTDRIQALQHRWKKYIDSKRGYVENISHLITFHEIILVSLWTFLPTLVDTHLMIVYDYFIIILFLRVLHASFNRWFFTEVSSDH